MFSSLSHFCCRSLLSAGIILTSLPSFGALSGEVMRAMDEANSCKKATQSKVIIYCMQQNNEFLQKSIVSSAELAIKKLPYSKQRSTRENITQKVKSNLKQCMNEASRIKNRGTAEQRHEYCVYENMLELLININNNLQIYSQ